MQPPAAAGDDLAAHRIEDNLVRVPDGQEVPQTAGAEPVPAPKPWYRRRLIMTRTPRPSRLIVATQPGRARACFT
jgi:hypothetical protein